MKASMAKTSDRGFERPGIELVPGYRLLAQVGSGGAGEVWSAEAPGGLRVALKIVRLTGGLGRREVANLRILRAIRHPNLLAYFGAWQIRDRLIIGMELADGSLWDRLAEARRQGLAGIPMTELLGVMGEVAKVIDFLNEPCHRFEGRSGVAIHHRDIKPQNIMMIGRGVKVADFGLSCLDDPDGASRSQCGLTFAYAAPETFRRQVSASSDQYSLAVTFCKLRGGRLPFVGPPAAVMMGHLSGDPDLSMLPEPERPILAKAMNKDPLGRWPDCRTLVEALKQCARAGAPDVLLGGPGCPQGPVESSASVEIPPLPDAWEGSPSSGSVARTGMEASVGDSVYCLNAPVAGTSDAEETVGTPTLPTVVMADLSGERPRWPISRLGLLAASILGAGLVAWSYSERIATRAAGPSPTMPAPVPTMSKSDRAAWTRSAELVGTASPPPMGRPVAAPAARSTPPAMPGPAWPPRSIGDSARRILSARLADLASWEPPVRKASTTARAWLASLATGPRTSSAPQPIPPARPPRPSRTSPPGLQLGLPDLLEIEAGRSIAIPIRLNRAGHDEAMSIHFDGAPAGVTMPDVTVPAGQDRAEVVARARLDAPAAVAPVAMSVRAGSHRADARLRVSVRANPAMLNRTRGHTLLACGRHDEAIAAFTEAIRAGVADSLVYNNRGLAYASLGQLDAAIRDYTEAVRLNPTDAAFRYNRGVALARRGDDVRALLDLDTAIRLQPGHARAYEARARIYRKHGDLARSCADNGRASELSRAGRADDRTASPTH